MWILLLSLVRLSFGTPAEDFLSEMKDFATTVSATVAEYDTVEPHECLARLQELIAAQEEVVLLSKELDKIMKNPRIANHTDTSIELVAERECMNVLAVELELALYASQRANERYKESLLMFQRFLEKISI